jgi:hypothetical protein
MKAITVQQTKKLAYQLVLGNKSVIMRGNEILPQ